MKLWHPVICYALFVASCGDFPRDPQGTLKRVQREGSFKVGLVAPLGQDAKAAEVPAFLNRLGAAASARPQIVTGDAEPLLNQLEEGELDLVIGRFEKKSPWGTLVDIGPPLRIEKHGKTEIVLAPVMRNGENAWIALIETQARNAGPAA